MNIIRDPEKANQYIFVTAVILFISSLFMPFVFVFFIQESLYFSKTHWYFEAPASAYITFLIGMIWIPIVLFVYLFVKWKFEPRFLKTITMLLLCLSIPFFMFGVSNYQFVDDEGMHFNYLNSLNKITTYEWGNFVEAKEVYEKDDNGTVYLKEYTLITREGSAITFPFRGKFREYKNRILAKLAENGVPLTSNSTDL